MVAAEAEKKRFEFEVSKLEAELRVQTDIVNQKEMLLKNVNEKLDQTILNKDH